MKLNAELMNKMTFHSKEEMWKFAEEFLASILKEKTSSAPHADSGVDGATVLALHGDLGSGKTTFTQGLAKALGIKGWITSPTFVLEKIYDLNDLENGGERSKTDSGETAGESNQKGEQNFFKKLVHIDAYRLEGAKDAVALGFRELLEDPANLIVIEWPEKIAEALPKNTIKLEFEHVNEETRVVKVYN